MWRQTKSVVSVGFNHYKRIGITGDAGSMTMAEVTALVAAFVGERVGVNGCMVVRVYLVNRIIPVSMRFFGHVPCAFSAHVEH